MSCSSTDIFDLPFFSEGGKNDTELVLKDSPSGCWSVARVELDGTSAASSGTLIDAGAIDGLDVLNTSPGPFPPPSTRSGVAIVGAFCFGAGSIDKREDTPTPDSKRGFFATGLSSSSSSFLSLMSPGRAGRPIVIFFVRFALGGGSDRLLDDFEFDGGGRDIDDFLDGGSGFAGEGLGGDRIAVCSLSLSLSLP